MRTLKHTTPRNGAWDILHSARVQKEIKNSATYFNRTHPFSGDFFSNTGIDARRAFGSMTAWEQTESMTILRRPVFIEPRHGWILCDPFHLVNDCLIDSSFVEKPKFSDYVK